MSEGTTEEHISNEDTTKKIDTKASIREKVWKELLQKKQGAFPLPPFGKIPNFKGVREATAKLLDIPEFQVAKSVEVNPDKSLEHCRRLVLEQGKTLYVPVPQLHGSFLLKKLEHDKKYEIYKIVSRWGIGKLGEDISFEDQIQIDLVIVGSVAVSKDGYRIGKGRGYADLEFALLKEMKAINNETIIITVVHDLQVFDKLPSDLFQSHDAPIDIIVTPTQIIRIEKKLPKPDGIYWNILTASQVQKISVLKSLKEKHESEGIDVTLCTRNETSPNKRHFFKRRYTRSWGRTPRTTSTDEANAITNTNTESKTRDNKLKQKQVLTKESNGTVPQINGCIFHTEANPIQNRDKKSPRKRRTFRRSPEESIPKDADNTENISPKNKKRKSPHDGYSLCVSNIEKSVRVRDLKSALKEKGIRPNFIVWKGFRGFCYLHYSTKKKDPENQEDFAIDNIIEKIQGININPTREQTLGVEVMDPITRIETVNVTSV